MAVSSAPPPRVIGKRPRASRFMRFLITITAVIQLPFAVAVAEGLHRWAGLEYRWAWAIGGALGVLGVYLFLGRAQNIMNDEPRPAWKTFGVDLTYYCHWSACLYCLIPSILYLVFEPIVDAIRGLPIGPNPGFFLWCYLSGLVVCTYGCTLRRWFFVKRHLDIPITGLDPALDGYTIAHLSDLHIGCNTPRWWGMRWVAATNEESPDLVVVTGDMVTSGTLFHDDIADIVGGLQGKDGVVVSMGNHDYFGDGEPLISLLIEKGVTVLRNAGQILSRAGGQMYLAAIDDTWTKRADMDRALEGRPEGMPTVLLAHDPDRFPHAVKRDVSLVLSGHTHGGQIAVPFIGRHINASRLAHKFHIGVYEDGESKLYVHPGLGTTGPPIRLGVAPAIVFLHLRAV